VIVGRSRLERHVMLALQALNLIQPIYLLSLGSTGCERASERAPPPLLYNMLYFYFLLLRCAVGWFTFSYTYRSTIIYNLGDVLSTLLIERTERLREKGDNNATARETRADSLLIAKSFRLIVVLFIY
jgi:hypothetical protein